MNSREIGGAGFAAMLRGGLAFLKSEADRINELNVFPIPDGDTGDNMVSTLSGGVRLAADCTGGIGEAAELAARGMLLGARGNSGVILSQMFEGVAKGLYGRERADAAALSAAFSKGVEQAYSSLSDPVEGTILTVMRLAAEYAGKNCPAGGTIEQYFSLYEREAALALEKTPDLLPVLKEAGTVDSGGAGLLSIVRGFLAAIRGESAEIAAHDEAAAEDIKSGAPDISLFSEDSELTFGYCTEFLLRLTHKKTDISAFSMDEFRKNINALGNSVVAFRQGSIVKVHVHVMEPWRVLEYAQQFGEFLTLKIENMNVQHSEFRRRETAAPVFKRRAAHKPYGIVAVGAGGGLCSAFRELGADIVIDSDLYGNPSVELFMEAVEAVNADCVFLLPDDKNVVGAAEEAARLCKNCEVRVLPTHTLGEGYVALSALDCGSGDDDEIFAGMNAEVSRSAGGAVARAVRGAAMNGVEVNEGDYIAITNKKILCASPDKTEAAVKLARILGADGRDFIIVFCGKDATKEERESCRAKMERAFPSAEYYEIDGGQKTYDFIIVLQ